MTLSDILAQVYAETGHNTAPPTAVATRIRRNVNEAYRAILRDPVCSKLRETSLPTGIVSVVDQAVYGLAAAASRILTMTERDNDRLIYPTTLRHIRESDPGLTATGSPYCYVPLGYRPYQYPIQTLVGTGLWVVSTAADTTQIMEINVVRAGSGIGGLASGDVSATLNGTTRVQLGTTSDYIDLQSARLNVAATGVVSLYDASTGGNIIAQLMPGQLAPQYFVVQLYPTPSSVITYYIDAEWRIVDLNDVEDIPIIPEEFHDLLATYARMREYEKTNDGRFGDTAALFTSGLNDLKYRLNTEHGMIHRVGGSAQRGFSRTGGMFPVDTF